MNVFDLRARIGLDSGDYDRELGKAESGFAAFGEKLKSGISTIAKVTAAGMTAAAAGVAALSKQAVEAYADFEQLEGGVETLFGAGGMSIEEYAQSVGKSVDEASEQYNKLMDAQDKVMANAADAYKNAGLSANEYMETVTSFSASLISSLGGDTQKAADYADKAIIDMSDNANKMGTSMEAIQNAYNGFAKQNYTMLDNLKLGYGGTASEMQRLIQDAEKLDSSFKASRDANGDLAMSYADIVDAIHIVQDNMGINGTTAKEAAATISGSIGMMKSAWTNLVTGVANDEADFDKLITNFVDSVDAAADNIIPRVEIALQGVGKLVEKLVPTILERVPELISETLPALTDSAGKMISTLGQALMDNADQLLLYAVNLIDEVWQAISESDVMTDGLSEFIDTLATRIPQMLSGITMVALKIVEKLSEALQDNESINVIMEAFANILYDIAETIAVGLPAITEAAFSLIKQIGQGLLDNVPWLLDEAITLVEELADYIAEAAPEMLPKIVELVGKLAKMLTAPEPITRLVKAAVQIVKALADAIIKSLPALIEAAPEIVQNLVDAIVDSLPILLDCAWELIKALTEAIFENIPALIDAGKKIIDSIGTGLMQALMSIDDICRQINDKINALMKEGIGFVLTAWKEWAQKFTLLFVTTLLKIVTKAKEFIKSALEWGKNFIENVRQGISDKWTDFKNMIHDVVNHVKEKFVDIVNSALDWGRNLIQNFVDKFKEKWESLKQNVYDAVNAVKDSFVEKVEAAKDWGRNLIQHFVDELKSKWENIKNGFFDITGNIGNSFVDLLNNAKNWGKDMIDNFVSGIKEKWENLKDTVSEVAGSIKEFLGFSEPKKGPLSNFHTYAPDMMMLFSQGVKDNAYRITDAIDATLYKVQNAFDIPHTAIGNVMTASNYAVSEIPKTEIAGANYNGDNIYNITVQAGTISNDYDANRAAQLMAEQLALLTNQQKKAVGL